jgi:hypothetical protein
MIFLKYSIIFFNLNFMPKFAHNSRNHPPAQPLALTLVSHGQLGGPPAFDHHAEVESRVAQGVEVSRPIEAGNHPQRGDQFTGDLVGEHENLKNFVSI